MHDIEKLVAFSALVATTVFLSTRPARGPGSIDASPFRQAAVLACCLGWGFVAGVSYLIAMVVLFWNGQTPVWPAFLIGIATAALCLAWLGRPWAPVDDGDQQDGGDVGAMRPDVE